MRDSTREEELRVQELAAELAEKLIAALPSPSSDPLFATAVFQAFGAALGSMISCSPLSRAEQIQAWRQSMDEALGIILARHTAAEALEAIAEADWIAEGDQDIH